jgi:hypothetical protein
MRDLFVNINLLEPTDYMMHQQAEHSTTVRSAHTVFMCRIFENKQLLVPRKLIGFITELKSVYSAVRTGALNKAVCASSLKG